MRVPRPIILLSVLTLLAGLAACGGGSTPTTGPGPAGPVSTDSPAPLPPVTDPDLVRPEDLEYLGAFRLPDLGDRPLTFEYGGGAMAFSPLGDPAGPVDGFPGSLFITGHDRLPYGELPEGGQLAEVSIPVPVIANDIAALNAAGFLQEFRDVTRGHFAGLDEIPRVGLAYLDTPATGPLLHIAWGQHLQPDPPAASHAWIGLDLSRPGFAGEWYIGDHRQDSVNGYILTIPSDWAAAYTGGQLLATGRFRDGGWGGMGPSLITYQPWVDGQGTPAAPGTRLDAIPLLLYESSMEAENVERALANYQHPDEWEGGAWLSTASGRSAVIFAGTKAIGTKYWYGWVNPAGADIPCVEHELVDQFNLCSMADGSPCPAADYAGCSGHNDYRGWWSTAFQAQIIFYNPADLARVAAGELQPWEPQPYAVLSIDDLLFHNPDGVEADLLGTGEQRRFRIGEVAYDQASGLLYILELFADGAKPVVHVWRVH